MKNTIIPLKNDFEVYGYNYYGYGIAESKKSKELDNQLRKFIELRKKIKEIIENGIKSNTE